MVDVQDGTIGLIGSAPSVEMPIGRVARPEGDDVARDLLRGNLQRGAIRIHFDQRGIEIDGEVLQQLCGVGHGEGLALNERQVQFRDGGVDENAVM